MAQKHKKKHLKSYNFRKSKLYTIGSIIGFIAIFGLYIYLTLPKVNNLYHIARTPKITLLARDDSIIANYGDLYHHFIKYEELPKHLVDAIIITEDRKFFSHQGIDILGIFRAFLTNILKQKIAQGGSTITQQLAKNLFLSSDRTITRKIQEIILAVQIEQKLTKKEILSLYLNKAYFGSGIYGISGAAQYYFNKDIKNITIAEAAVLAALFKAPSRYNPHFSKENSIKRGKIILKTIYDLGYISEQQYNQQLKNLYNLKKPLISNLQKSHFSDWIIEQINDLFIDRTQDLIVKTTLDIQIQNIVQKNLDQLLEKKGKPYQVQQGAVIIINDAGEVISMIGGKKYEPGGFNRAVHAKRQPGSLFKIFTYITAFENEYSPDDIILDGPININGWSPKNDTHKYYGPVTLKDAFAHSLNAASVRLAEQIGRSKIIETAHQLGIESEIKNQPSMSLGTFENNLLEITGSFSTIMRDGYQISPFGIREIAQANGKVLFKKQYDDLSEPILKSKTIAFIKDLLWEVINSGSGKKASINEKAYGKTGTSQDRRDGWFIGFNNRYTIGIWMGNDKNSPTKLYGGSLPAELWAKLIKKLN